MAPHFNRGSGNFAELCTAAGMRLVQLDNDGQSTPTNHSLDCPACLGSLALPPEQLGLVSHNVVPFANVAAPAVHFARRDTLTASARGPPLTA